jgi:DNA-binding NarL/FixJ family response regulator
MRVCVVEDADVICDRLVKMINEVAGVVVAGQTGSVGEAIAMIMRERPDAVVLDMKLADGNGLDVLRAVNRDAPEVAVIVLTNYADDYYRELCMRSGARYFFDKSSQFVLILDALRDLGRKPLDVQQ